jgi:hypothetical protein
MEKLTTTEGDDIYFDPKVVSAVSDYDPIFQARVTCVYGLGAGAVKIAKSIDDFLGSLGVADKYVKLPREQNSSIWVDGRAVVVVAPLAKGKSRDAGARTVLTIGSTTITVVGSVKETIADIPRMNPWNGANASIPPGSGEAVGGRHSSPALSPRPLSKTTSRRTFDPSIWLFSSPFRRTPPW